MSAIEKAAAMLREEAEAIKASHTLFGDWCGDPTEADYHEMIAVADAAIAERDALRAKIEQMEKQEPVFWWRQCSDGTYEGPIHNNSIERVRKQSGAWSPLYALPGAQPTPSAPNLDMDALERKNDALKEEVGRLRDALALIADQYEPKCTLLIPSIARSALCATGTYGQAEAQPTPSALEREFLERVIGLCSHRGPSPSSIEAFDPEDKWIADLWRQAREMLAAAPKPEGK